MFFFVVNGLRSTPFIKINKDCHCERDRHKKMGGESHH